MNVLRASGEALRAPFASREAEQYYGDITEIKPDGTRVTHKFPLELPNQNNQPPAPQ